MNSESMFKNSDCNSQGRKSGGKLGSAKVKLDSLVTEQELKYEALLS